MSASDQTNELDNSAEAELQSAELQSAEPHAETENLGDLQQSFKCKSCAAKMVYKPGTSAQTCPYCGHDNIIAESAEQIEEIDFRSFLAQSKDDHPTTERLTVKCVECTAETTMEPNITSQECPFCGVDIVATAKSSKCLKPASLLPFSIERKDGWELFQKWLQSLWFAPNRLKQFAKRQEKLAGIYVPYWTYDSDTLSAYTGSRGEHYWETEYYTDTDSEGNTTQKSRQVQKTRWYPASGNVRKFFDDILVLASKSLPKKYADKLEPWDLGNLIPYADEYLSGFRAESYQVELTTGFDSAREIMDATIRTMVRNAIGGDEQRISSVNTQHSDITFKHILLPIWISTYRYNEKPYTFLINARTGEVQGERPWSWMKISAVVLAVAGAIATIIYYANQ